MVENLTSKQSVLRSGISHALDVLADEVDFYDDDSGNPPRELGVIRGLIAHLNGTLMEADCVSVEPPAPASKAKLASFWTRLTALAGDMEAELNRSAVEPAAALSAQGLALAMDRFEDPKDQGTFAEGFERGRSHEAEFRVLIDQKLRRLAEPPPTAPDYSVMDVEDEYRERQIANRDEAIERLEQQKENLLNALEAKQARIDALMLEYCPGQMSASQRAAWSASQERASAPQPTARRIELLNLLEDRERKHDAFRLAEQGGQYAVELTAFDRAHAEVIDWVTDHADELLPLLRPAPPPKGDPVCGDELKLIYEHGQPYGIRDRGGYLFFFTKVPKFDNQEERYRNDLARRARLADFLLDALHLASETKTPAQVAREIIQSQVPMEGPRPGWDDYDNGPGKKEVHHELCDVNDRNAEGIVKPCNCKGRGAATKSSAPAEQLCPCDSPCREGYECMYGSLQPHIKCRRLAAVERCSVCQRALPHHMAGCSALGEDLAAPGSDLCGIEKLSALLMLKDGVIHRFESLAHHLRQCQKCGETDVADCFDGSQLWTTAFSEDDALPSETKPEVCSFEQALNEFESGTGPLVAGETSAVCSMCGGTRQVPCNWTTDGKNACPQCTDYR